MCYDRYNRYDRNEMIRCTTLDKIVIIEIIKSKDCRNCKSAIDDCYVRVPITPFTVIEVIYDMANFFNIDCHKSSYCKSA